MSSFGADHFWLQHHQRGTRTTKGAIDLHACVCVLGDRVLEHNVNDRMLGVNFPVFYCAASDAGSGHEMNTHPIDVFLSQ